jgi:hypothetical protein
MSKNLKISNENTTPSVLFSLLVLSKRQFLEHVISTSTFLGGEDTSIFKGGNPWTVGVLYRGSPKRYFNMAQNMILYTAVEQIFWWNCFVL